MTCSESRIIVGVTQRIDVVEGRNECRDALDQQLVKWLIDAGFLPVPIPNMLIKANDTSVIDAWLQMQHLNALVFSGGNNIGEFVQRDSSEKHLLSWAELNHIPVLGICRGMQMLATWAGVELIPVTGHVKTRHELLIKGSKNEWPRNVNSYHDWSLSSCPKQFKVAAKADDGNIEAIYHDVLPWEGWMWHPEREQPFCAEDIMRVKRLFNGKQ